MKKYNLENIGKIAKMIKEKGKKIGLCHGVFGSELGLPEATKLGTS